MKNKVLDQTIPAEVIAAFLDGNATAAESGMILNSLADDAELRELMNISQAVDFEMLDCGYPVNAMAAACGEGNFCCLECEKFILRKHNVEFDQAQLLENAIRNGWQKEEGTALHNVGKHLEANGFTVQRAFGSTLGELEDAMAAGKNIIVAVDGGELLGNRFDEMMEDIVEGEKPDHLAVVLSVQKEDGTITIFDPNSSNPQDTYPLAQFCNAWADSKGYMVVAGLK